MVGLLDEDIPDGSISICTVIANSGPAAWVPVPEPAGDGGVTIVSFTFSGGAFLLSFSFFATFFAFSFSFSSLRDLL